MGKIFYGLVAVLTCCFLYALGHSNGKDVGIADPHFVDSLRTTLDESTLYAQSVMEHDLPSLKKERDALRARVNVAKNYATTEDVRKLLDTDATIEQKETALAKGNDARHYLKSFL